MSTRSYSLVEPHPSARPHTYLSTGRGGSGNHIIAPTNLTRGSDASGPSSKSPSLRSASTATTSTTRHGFTTGRGGLGNAHPSVEQRAIFSFDEELERELARQSVRAPVYHVGRGGAGNTRKESMPPRTVDLKTSRTRRESHESGASEGSVRSGMSARSSAAESGADVATRKIGEGIRRIVGAA